jgi:hypothetical protein
MPNLKIGVSALALLVLTAMTIAIANPSLQNGQQNPTPQIPKTWDEQAMATLEVPLAAAAASPVPVSADYYYRMPVRPIYKTYPVYHPSKEPSGYFDRLQGLEGSPRHPRPRRTALQRPEGRPTMGTVWRQ